jgi:hypothetical protein
MRTTNESPPIDVALILAFTFIAHIVVDHIAFRLGIRDVKC